MRSFISPSAWARYSARHPRAVIVAWVAAFVVSVAIIFGALSGALTSATSFTNNPESDRAAALIADRIGVRDAVVETVVVTAPDGRVDRPDRRAAVEALAGKLRALGPKIVAGAVTPWTGGGPQLLSKDGRTALVPVTMTGELDTARDNIADVVEVVTGANGSGGLAVRITGQTSIEHDTQHVAETDLQKGEAIGIPIALVILILVFGALVSALLPVGLAVVSIVVSLALTALVGHVYPLSFFVVNMLTMMGLAVGIDYVLFIVSRFREERAAGVERIDAIGHSADTAGRAVFFSGITVVVALVGMLIVPTTIFVSLAVGAILVVLVAVAASTTLLPAVLSVLGDRIERGRLPRLSGRGSGGGIWPRVVSAVMRRPGVSLAAGVAVLLAAAVPYATINTGVAGIETMPKDLQSRVAFEALARDFQVGTVSPAQIPIVGDPTSPENRAEIARITTATAGDPIYGTPALAAGAGPRGGVLNVPINADPASSRAEDAVRHLRETTELPVGGQTAQNIDFFDVTDRYLPIVVGVVLTLSFLVLLVAFRSIVVPVVAILMNLLSVGAAFGLLTLVTQHGVGAGLLGFQQVDTVEAWIPLFLFSVLFGLSMDYHVFLLSRIKERFDATGDNAESIHHGISSSARLITGAALIMVAVFAGFASGDLVMFQQMGFGLGIAVLIDATIVRSVLVPAAMKLLGRWNWYLPRVLGWLPHIAIEAPRREAASGS